MDRKKGGFLICALLLVAGIAIYKSYRIFGEIIKKDGIIYIRSNDQIDDVRKKLTEFTDKNSFDWLSKKKKYTQIKAGKYLLKKGMSLNDVINLLRNGNQTPVNVTFNNLDTLEEFSGRISTQIETDSMAILEAFKERTFLRDNSLTQASVLSILIPNTYELYWNTTAEEFRDRMLKEYVKFWNEERTVKAAKLKMSPQEIMILASIVQKETTRITERPTIAGLYINRLKKGIPLQADPTIVYLLKKQNNSDFKVRRVLFKDLKINSPYNTYLFRGLPPSIIAMPDISSIDAVLNHQKHSYLYMCADIEKIGFHKFASTLQQHNRNTVKYQRWLKKQGIRR